MPSYDFDFQTSDQWTERTQGISDDMMVAACILAKDKVCGDVTAFRTFVRAGMKGRERTSNVELSLRKLPGMSSAAQRYQKRIACLHE